MPSDERCWLCLAAARSGPAPETSCGPNREGLTPASNWPLLAWKCLRDPWDVGLVRATLYGPAGIRPAPLEKRSVWLGMPSPCPPPNF